MAAPLIRADGFVAPCIPSLAQKPPSGPDWVHEIKHDGYRLIVRRDGKAVRLFTRRGHDWTDRYPGIAAVAAKLRARSFTMDGEAAVSGADGIAVFEALHRRRAAPDAILHAFDLLELNGKDLRLLPLGERKTKLAKLLAGSTAGIVFNEHTDEDGAVVFQHACRFGLEGIVSKRLSAPYRSRTVTGLDQGQEPRQPRHAQGASGDVVIACTALGSAAVSHQSETRPDRRTIRYSLGKGASSNVLMGRAQGPPRSIFSL